MEPQVKTQNISKASGKTQKKSLEQKLTPQKSHADFKIKSSLKQKGIQVTVKTIDWIEAVEAVHSRHHVTMQTIVY